MLRAIGRLVDALLSRGEGLDARVDPFGPPCPPDEVWSAMQRSYCLSLAKMAPRAM